MILKGLSVSDLTGDRFGFRRPFMAYTQYGNVSR